MAPVTDPEWTNAATDLSTYIERVAAAAILVDTVEFARLWDDRQNAGPVVDLDRLVAFAEDQLIKWYVRWMFSPVTLPDVDASRQSLHWRSLHDDLAARLSHQLPGMQAVVAQRLARRSVEYSLRIRSQQNQGHPILSTAIAAWSWLAHRLNSLGFPDLAERAMKIAMFPPHTIG